MLIKFSLHKDNTKIYPNAIFNLIFLTTYSVSWPAQLLISAMENLGLPINLTPSTVYPDLPRYLLPATISWLAELPDSCYGVSWPSKLLHSWHGFPCTTSYLIPSTEYLGLPSCLTPAMKYPDLPSYLITAKDLDLHSYLTPAMEYFYLPRYLTSATGHPDLPS